MSSFDGTRRIWTYNGLYVDPIHMTDGDINFEDIANSLAKICRFGGHIDNFYSVAQHSVLVSQCVEYMVEEGVWDLGHWNLKDVLLQALFHDGSEAYLGDMLGPNKKYFFINTGSITDPILKTYKAVETHVQNLIYSSLALPVEEHYTVHLADKTVLQVEGRHLKGNISDQLWDLGYPEYPCHFYPVGPIDSKVLFMKRFKELTE